MTRMVVYCQSCGARAFHPLAGPGLGACAGCGGRVWMNVPPFAPACITTDNALWLETVDAVAVSSESLERLRNDLSASTPPSRPRRSRSRAQLRVIKGGGE